MALRWGAHAICEKPLVLNPWNLDALSKMEQTTVGKIYNILQLRYHPAILNLKNKVNSLIKKDKIEIDLTYITSRGSWYANSWKGDVEKSGGIATNIGVHFFDMLAWIFGNVIDNIVHYHSNETASGYLEFKKAKVRWFLSINSKFLPNNLSDKNQRTFRSIKIGEEELEFSYGFTDLHKLIYEDILNGNGFGIEDSRRAIEIVHEIRTKKLEINKGEKHLFFKKINEIQ